MRNLAKLQQSGMSDRKRERITNRVVKDATRIANSDGDFSDIREYGRTTSEQFESEVEGLEQLLG